CRRDNRTGRGGAAARNQGRPHRRSGLRGDRRDQGGRAGRHVRLAETGRWRANRAPNRRRGRSATRRAVTRVRLVFAQTFIRRPVLASVCSLVIIIAGLISIPTLPIAQFPELAPPSVQVSAFYTGASAETVETAVTVPLEQAINGVEGMQYITSTSGND